MSPLPAGRAAKSRFLLCPVGHFGPCDNRHSSTAFGLKKSYESFAEEATLGTSPRDLRGLAPGLNVAEALWPGILNVEALVEDISRSGFGTERHDKILFGR